MATPEYWAVTVEADGEKIVTIESQALSGREISGEDERTIEKGARHLLAFIGKSHLLQEEDVAGAPFCPRCGAFPDAAIQQGEFAEMAAALEAKAELHNLVPVPGGGDPIKSHVYDTEMRGLLVEAVRLLRAVESRQDEKENEPS